VLWAWTTWKGKKNTQLSSEEITAWPAEVLSNVDSSLGISDQNHKWNTRTLNIYYLERSGNKFEAVEPYIMIRVCSSVFENHVHSTSIKGWLVYTRGNWFSVKRGVSSLNSNRRIYQCKIPTGITETLRVWASLRCLRLTERQYRCRTKVLI
jgi:hypothetical protein